METVCLWCALCIAWNSLQASDCWKQTGFRAHAILLLPEVIFLWTFLVFMRGKPRRHRWWLGHRWNLLRQVERGFFFKMSYVFPSGSHVMTPSFFFFFFLIWLPHSIWSNWTRNQIWAAVATHCAASATLNPQPPVLGCGLNLRPSTPETLLILLCHSGNSDPRFFKAIHDPA